VNRFPLAPDPVGIRRLIGDAPVQIPKACVARGFIEETDDNEVGVADAVSRKVMNGEEGLESEAHARGILERVGFLTNGVNKLREWDALLRKCRLSGRLGIRADAGRDGKQNKCTTDGQTQQRFHRNPRPSSL